jgi:hypothetical protein
MFTRLDSNDPESLHKFLQENGCNAAKDAIRPTMVLGWWLLPKDQRTEDILEREIRRLVDDAIREFREDRDRFLSPEASFFDPTKLVHARNLILKIGQDRFGAANEWICESLMAITQGERLRYLLEKAHSASSCDDLMPEG